MYCTFNYVDGDNHDYDNASISEERKQAIDNNQPSDSDIANT